MSNRPEIRRPHLDPILQRRRAISLQRHSPGPDQTANDLSELLPWDPETDQLRHVIPGSASAILRFEDGYRVSQPGEGRLAEQGQITSGRVIPNHIPLGPRINGPPAVTTEVKRVLKRKVSPPKQARHRPGSTRLLKEANDLDKLQPEGCHAAPKADDLYEWAAVVEGPEHTVYEGGTFFCTIYVPRDYPFNPPKVTFHTRIYHCNINAQGEVCLDILKDKWNATMSIATVLMSLRTLMINCNPDDALVCPIGRQFKENREEFDKKARQWTRRYASTGNVSELNKYVRGEDVCRRWTSSRQLDAQRKQGHPRVRLCQLPPRVMRLLHFVLIGLVTHVQSECDLFEEALTLNCVSPLVSYASPSQTALHPALSDIDRHCRDYNSYLLCTAGVRPLCRASRAGHVEKMYGMMCEDKYLAIVREERDCLLDLERDLELRQCFLNRTNILRDETNSPTSPLHSYECSVIQAYVDCLLEREIDSCADAVKVEVSLLSLLATRDGSNCNLLTNNTKSKPPPLEVCDRSGDCQCRLPGYVFDKESRRCIDIDECSDVPCSQRCTNTPGSFTCSCDEQYFHLAPDNHTCIRNDEEPLWLFFAHGQSIWNISADGRTFQLQRAGLQKTAMIDIDVQERRLYYADIGAHAIERMNIEGTFSQDVQRQDVEGLEGIAVDWIARNLYSLRKTDILVQSLSGRFRKILYRDAMRLPRAIALHPHRGLMFVSDWSSTAFIAAAATDGSNFKKIVTERLTWPNAITVDVHADRIYWADAFLDIIEMANLDGTGRRTIVGDAGSVPHIFGLAVADEFLYWTDWTYRGLLRAHKLTGDNITVLAQTALLPYSIKAFHKSLQPPGQNTCSEMSCSQLCLLGAGGVGAKCACGDGFELADDNKTCVSNCGRTEIECGGRDPKCISRLYLCDGVAHCADKEDEISCPPRICLPGQFQCHGSKGNKQCVSSGGLCDGVADCDDRSDEDFCPTRTL